jgi:hypothetical protein
LISSWGQKQDLGQAARSIGATVDELRAKEHRLEVAVSVYVGSMPLLWIDVPDPPSPSNRRVTIEREAIALLSNWNKPTLDPPSSDWLGLWSDRDRVRGSGLWNNRHVEQSYDPTFLTALEDCVAITRPPSR